MDEPTASLDGDTGHEIVRFVHENVRNEKRCIVIVTHDRRIYEFADRVLEMENGRLGRAKKSGDEAGNGDV
jgi:putative ABC transport system ATP-binding protein